MTLTRQELDQYAGPFCRADIDKRKYIPFVIAAALTVIKQLDMERPTKKMIERASNSRHLENAPTTFSACWHALDELGVPGDTEDIRQLSWKVLAEFYRDIEQKGVQQ